MLKKLVTSSIALCCLMASAHAKTPDVEYVNDLGFFGKAQIAGTIITPVTIMRDRRCADRISCSADGLLTVAFVTFDGKQRKDLLLSLGEPKRFADGVITLTDAGTPPSRNGAINVKRYALDLVYVPKAR